jgi:hypothetical protein
MSYSDRSSPPFDWEADMRFFGAALVCIAILYDSMLIFMMDVTSQACSGRWPTFISTGSHRARLRLSGAAPRGVVYSGAHVAAAVIAYPSGGVFGGK